MPICRHPWGSRRYTFPSCTPSCRRPSGSRHATGAVLRGRRVRGCGRQRPHCTASRREQGAIAGAPFQKARPLMRRSGTVPATDDDAAPPGRRSRASTTVYSQVPPPPARAAGMRRRFGGRVEFGQRPRGRIGRRVRNGGPPCLRLKPGVRLAGDRAERDRAAASVLFWTNWLAVFQNLGLDAPN